MVYPLNEVIPFDYTNLKRRPHIGEMFARSGLYGECIAIEESAQQCLVYMDVKSVMEDTNDSLRRY